MGIMFVLGEKGSCALLPTRVLGYRSAEDINSSVRGTPSLFLFFPPSLFELSRILD